jgi:hypothetical protein
VGRELKLVFLCCILAGAVCAKPVISERLLPTARKGMAAQISENTYFVVVFESAVQASDAERILLNAGLERLEHPDLLPGHYVVSGTLEALFQLAGIDGPAYIYPASRALIERQAVMSCSGPLTEGAIAAPYTAVVGQGWDGYGRRSAELTYSLEKGSDLLPDSVVIGAIERALAEWSSVAALHFSRTYDTRARRNINILFASGAHDDPFPFDGRGRVLAHAFYPAGTNPEPIAGDLHLDADETWSDGGATDVFSVILHELGHSLGLGHSDHPEAVMYPYYRASVTLHDEDVAAIRLLYEAVETPATPAPAPPPEPSRPATPESASPLRIQTTTDRLTQNAAVSLSGTVTGGSGTVRVTYAMGAVAGVATGGRSWSISRIALPLGPSQILIEAEDQAGNRASVTVKVVRTEAAPASGQSDTARPVVKVTSPALNTYLTGKETLTISGMVTDKSRIRSVTCSRSGAIVQATGTDRWSCEVPLLIGDNRISVTATDAAGNESFPKQLVVTRR